MIGRALGPSIESDIDDRIWTSVLSFPPDGRASTAVDLENGCSLEIDWISDAAARLATKAGIEASLNAARYALLLLHREGR